VYDENDEIFILSVDGVDCSINEPRKIPSAKWYAHKFNGPGLSYELGISIYDNYLVWIRGPERAGDLEAFRAPNGLKSKIPAGKKVIADSAYKDPVCSMTNRRNIRHNIAFGLGGY
jgi:hypothetical protein